MLHATDTKHVPATAQEATCHFFHEFSVASPVVPDSVVSLLLLLARCLCALFGPFRGFASFTAVESLQLSSQLGSRDNSAASFQPTSGRADHSIPEASHDRKKA